MAKLTLLDIVQDILSDMNDDTVNSIEDTEESGQVARIVKSSYFEMMANKNWPHLRDIIQIDGLSDVSKPVYFTIQDNVKEVISFQYNNVKLDGSSSWTDMRWVEPDEYLRRTSNYDTNNPDTQIITDPSGVELTIKTKQDPEFYTSFDDKLLVFNSFNSDKDTTLHKSKTRVVVYRTPTWSHVDSFIADLPEEAFPALLAEAKSTAFTRIKQAPDQKSEQQARRQRAWLSRKAFVNGGGIRHPNYGRR